MDKIVDSILWFLLLISWILGAVLAKGFWLTSLSIFFPFYAWYLVIEKLAEMLGLV